MYVRQMRGWVGVGLCALALAGCGVAVVADKSQVGGGPEQATAQARAHYQSTVVAVATANALTAGYYNSGQPCDCESTGK